jgi:hypothetical protein
MKKKKLALLLSAVALTFSAQLVVAAPSFASPSVVRPSGMIVKDENGAYFYVYYTPGTGYADPRLKYIGQPQVLDYYLKRGRKAYPITNAERATYTIHNHNLSLPCGEAARDNNGTIGFFGPLEWPPGAQDQADPIFSYAENFPEYVGYLAPKDVPGLPHYEHILLEDGWNNIAAVDGLAVSEAGINPLGIPNCVIVKQSGTGDYYRVFRHMTQDGVEVERKMHIPTVEMLGLWRNFNSYVYETDITSLPDVGNVRMPPGLLVRSTANATVYFTDDEGRKVLIPTQAIFDSLGFSAGDVTFVSQGALDSTPTATIY